MDVLIDALRTALGPQAALYALAAVGLNLHYGYTGMLNFGQVGFMLVGAYGIAIGVSTFGWPLWAALILTIVAAVGYALLLGLPTVRLRADYLAITTLAAGEAMRLLFRSHSTEEVTGGVFGLTRFANEFYELNPIPRGRYGFGNLVFSHQTLWVMIVGWVLAVAAALLVWRLAKSPWGRVALSIREDEEVVRSAGKSVVSIKIQSLVLGGVMGAGAGAVLAISQQAVAPDAFIPEVTFFAYAAVILGGVGRAWGPLVGAVMFWFLISVFDSGIRALADTGAMPDQLFSADALGAYRFVLVGFGLMALMIFRPQGIFGDRNEMVLGDH
ncbi:branched-chain amino acid ABC transporter permease [Nocardioides sp. LHD-245]|uniref:branched-chain amino acid ABC transporter permease n=1 Tax=Nocardioides sp. LHD-245 TaxID=3051387 RepID=UPI0027DF4E72|nr:branched-chain amino acid ABC transporter permease [Nocardioides sp. LHD-245]